MRGREPEKSHVVVEGSNEKDVIALFVLAGILLGCQLLSAHQHANEATPAASDQDVQLLRKDLRSKRNKLLPRT